MAKKKIKGTRILAAILTAAMVFTSTPYTALAAESEAGYVTVQNEIEQTGQADDGTGNNGNNGENGGKGNNGAGDFSDGSDKDGGNSGTGDISDNNGGNGETGDVSGGNGGTGDVSGGSGRDVSGSDSEVSVSGNDIAVYGAAATATGTLTVEGNSGSYSYDAENDVITVKNGANLTFHSADGYGAENPSQTRIYVEKDAKATLTLDGVYINVSDKAVSPLEIAEDSTGAVSVVLKGSNALTAGEKAAGIQKNGTADGTLTISGSGALTAQGGKYGAGIGSGYEKAGSNISISGGEVTATGGYGGAGIGGGMYGAGSSITISGGMVTTTGGNGGAGIGSGYSRSASNITISGGTVIAKGGYNGAGIGGGKNGAGSNISISGGEVTATGGGYGAGIGGGYCGVGSNITISGGEVTATGGENGAGIGGGDSRDGNDITISGGTVTATGGGYGAGIGGGNWGSTGKVTITGGSVKTTKGVLTGVTNGTDEVYCTVVDLTEEFGIEAAVTDVGETAYGMKDVMTDADGKIYMYLPAGETSILLGMYYYTGTVSAEAGADNRLTRGKCRYDLLVLGDPAYYERNEIPQGILIKDGANLTVKSGNGYGKDNYSQTRIEIEKDASVTLTLDGTYIDTIDTTDSPILIPENSTGNVNIILKGENGLKAGRYYAAIQKDGDAENIGTLTISGDGALIAQGGKQGAGIGGGHEKAGNNIVISGGEVTATGGEYAAGIGGGMYGSGSSITISGGTVTATGGECGAGVGSGYYESGSNITISGGTVIAQGGNQGAGIGGGKSGAGNNIDISGGTVIATATAGDDGATGAGIGGGYAGMGNNITISGGTVTAISSVTGEYSCAGAGIGGGFSREGNNITISGGTVTALSTADEALYEGYGIGSGWGANDSTPMVTGGNIKVNKLCGIQGKDGDEPYEAYLARADLLPLAGKNAVVGNPVLQTYNKKTGETKTLSYNLKDVCTMEDGYLYMYLPADTEDTVTRLVFDNAVYEATVKKFDYGREPGRYSDFTLISSTDGKAEYGEVLREDVPDDGIIPDGIWMTDLQAGGYTYTGKAITPSFRVYDGKKMLAVKKDYTVSYKNNIKAATADDAKKAPTITVKSTGNYKGTETRTFTITPASLKESNPQIKAEDLYLAAPTGKNPKGIKAVPVVTDNGKKLSENKDYTVNHVTLNGQNPENKNANSYVTPGKYTVEITGKGNYTGTRQITVILADVAKEQILMSKVTVARVPDVTYDADLCDGNNAKGMTPALTVTYGSGKNKVTLYKEGDVNAAGETVSAENADYTVNWINNRYVGTATAVLTGTGKILEDGTASGTYFGEKRITFRIKGTALSASMVSWADGSKNVSVVYNGEEQEPRVRVSLQKKVKGKDGKMVTQTTYLREYNEYYKVGDYKVSYLKNVDAGTATVVITGVGGYTGTVKKTFKITQADLAAEGIEAKIAASGAQSAYGSHASAGSYASAESNASTGSNASGAIKVAFAKNGAKPAIVVTAKLANGNTVTLKEGKDYTITYANNKAVSEGKNLTEKKLPLITVKGKGNFKGSIKQTFTITNKSLADKVNPITVTVADVPANKNKGKFVSKPVVTDETGTKLKEKTDYTLSYSLLMANGEETKLDVKKDVVNEPGSTIRITITGAGNYQGEGSVLTADYRITELDFKKVTVKVVPKTLPYTTKPVTLTEEDLILTMKVGTGKQAVVEELKLITDGDDTKDGYKIIGYKNNVNKGTAQVTLQGCGKYGGTKTVKFYIGTRPFLWWLRNV
ncbi:MAG: hypothetical protein UGE21_03515 [Lachnospiraceae bacterium]|nr:hypothetical protein [Lachnospiraceae bacterium]